MSILVNTVLLTVIFFSFLSVQATSATSKEIRLHRDADDESTEAAVTEATPGAVDKTTRKGLLGSAKDVIDKIQEKFNKAINKTKEAMDKIKEQINDSIGIMQNGISNIFDKVLGLFKSQKRSRSLTVVESEECNEETFLNTQHAITHAPSLLIDMVIVGGMDNDSRYALCDIIMDYSSYAINYLQNCIESNEDIYRYTALMIEEAKGLVRMFCNDMEYRMKIQEGSLAAIKPKRPCFKKYAEELVAQDLLSPAVGERKRKKRSTPEEIGNVCDTMQKVTRCTKKASNDIEAAEKIKTFEKTLESNITNIVDHFCNKQKRSMPSVEVTVPTTVTLPSDVTDKKPASKGVLESSVPILCYLSVIVLLV